MEIKIDLTKPVNIEIKGAHDILFEKDHLGSCRDASNYAIAKAINVLSDQLKNSIRGNWKNDKVVIDD